MKRLAAAVMIAVMIFGICACKKEEQTPSEATEAPITTGVEMMEEDEDISAIKIGFSLAGAGAFYDQLIQDIEAQCTTHNYDAQIKTADTAEQQESDILSLLSTGCAVIVVDPVAVDELESALSECEIQHVPVISIIDQVNGTVNMLISPYYKKVGERAGDYAVDLVGSDGGSVMMLNTDCDSFTMQLMADGFIEAIGEDKDVTLAADPFCRDDEEKAYTLVAQALSGETAVDFVFAHSAVLARGARRAIDEAGAPTQLVVFGGDMDIIEAVQAGDVYAAIFIGPGQLAERAVHHADKFILNMAYEAPQFDELSVGIVTAENVAEYLSETSQHAEIK